LGSSEELNPYLSLSHSTNAPALLISDDSSCGLIGPSSQEFYSVRCTTFNVRPETGIVNIDACLPRRRMTLFAWLLSGEQSMLDSGMTIVHLKVQLTGDNGGCNI
jgi:hypothetical protein